VFYLGLWFCFDFEVSGKASQDIETTFVKILGLLWIVFLSEAHEKMSPKSIADPIRRPWP